MIRPVKLPVLRIGQPLAASSAATCLARCCRRELLGPMTGSFRARGGVGVAVGDGSATGGAAGAAERAAAGGVGGEGLGTVEQRVEHLVVAGGGHVEQLTDGLLLGARELPPLPFEGEDGSVALRQLAGDRRGTGQCPRYLHRQLPRLARAWELTPLSFWHGRPTDCRRTHT